MGLGYIGLPTAIIAAKHGIQVIGVDINPKVVEMTNQGRLHIIEPGMVVLLREVVGSGALKASAKPEVSDAYFMVVPTPFKGNHEPDISYVEAATRAVLPYLKAGDLYVIESTSPVGTTDKMAALIFHERPELKGKIYIAYCPERVLPGNVIYELVHNDRVIGGLDEASTDKAIAFYSQFVQGTLHRTNCKTAEMCKLTENSSRDVQIAFRILLTEEEYRLSATIGGASVELFAQPQALTYTGRVRLSQGNAMKFEVGQNSLQIGVNIAGRARTMLEFVRAENGAVAGYL